MPSEIIGRQEELLALGAFLDAAPAGGQALVFEGDAGIGKTVLWQEGIRLARERGFRVLIARASQSELQVAFATVADLFGPVMPDALSQLAPIQRRALEVALLLREPDARPPEARLLATALLSIVRLCSRDEPLVLALDDLQWVDASSAEVLRFAFRRLEDERVGVLATLRGRPAELPLEFDRTFAAVRRAPVESLSVTAIQRLVWDRLELSPPRPVLMRLHQITGGNPFFALELGRALGERTVNVDGAEVALPDSLRAVVAERLEALPERVQETLAAVAALAAPSVTILEPLTATTVEDIELAQRRGVLELELDRIHFTHPLLAPAAYEAMPLHRRRGLHRRLAGLEIDPEERARHLALASSGPDEEIAAALATAARRARARGAAQVAAELADRAVALTPAHPPDVLDRRRITAAEHWLYAGDSGRARALLETVVEYSAPGAIRAEALVCLAGTGPAMEGFRWSEAVHRRALAEPGLEIRQKVIILCELGWLAAAGLGGGDGIAEAAEGLALAEQLGEPEVLAIALTTLARVSFWRTGRIRRDLLDCAIELERSVGAGGNARVLLGRVLNKADRHDEARTLWSELIEQAAERADPWLVGRLMFRAELELSAGAWQLSRGLCSEAIELAREIGWSMFEPLCSAILAQIAACSGEAGADERILESLAMAERVGYGDTVYILLRALGTLELSRGSAGSFSQRAAEHLDGRGLNEHLAQLAGAAVVEALIAEGELAQAERLLAKLEDFAVESETAVRSLAKRCRGVLLAASGDHDAAIGSLELAAAEPEPPLQANPLELARTLLALGTVHRQAQHKRAAREALERAAEIFERLGARLWLEKTRSELRRIGGRMASSEQLSETERRIVELVVAGRRNREVASELSLSANTVAWNLSKVYRKLGVSSRTELAALLAAASQG